MRAKQKPKTDRPVPHVLWQGTIKEYVKDEEIPLFRVVLTQTQTEIKCSKLKDAMGNPIWGGPDNVEDRCDAAEACILALCAKEKS